ncbi:MAG: hypothetical protein WC740_03260 [Verrucomicrobiia bacterium]
MTKRDSFPAILSPRAAAGPATAPAVIKTVEEETKTRLAPPWHVIVRNDLIHLLAYVEQLFIEAEEGSNP